MAGEIGIIKTVLGTVLAIDGAGSPRKLLAGDRVFSDELIKTAAFAVVEIEFADGFTMDLGSNSLTSLSEIAPSHQIKPTSKIQLTVSKHYSKP
tara:strand:- start:4345 stop:4626 length:282 start_codon:yes stop_codon:yes gene_type:complete